MKIAFLTPEFPNPKTGQSGGIGTSIFNLSKGLVAAGHEVAIIIYGQKKDEVFHDGGLVFYSVANRHVKGISWYLTRRKIERLINTLYAEKKIDLIEAADWTGITSFIKPDCPVIVRLHGSDTYFCHLDKRPVKWFNKFHERRALKNADHLLSVSRYTAEVTRELFSLDRNFTVIPNCVDVSQFTDLESANDSVTILYFGTLIRKKGMLELPYIFNAVFAQNPLAKLVLAGRDTPDIKTGNPSTWEIMATLFEPAAFKNVSYIGSVAYSEIKNLISGAAVCVFPTFAEALPVSWIEAMSMRKAIVASDIGWAPEVIVDGHSGFLVDPEDHKKFAGRVCELLDSPVLNEQLGKNARQRAIDKFDISVVAGQNINFYTNATKR